MAVNISWNSHHWQRPYTDPRAGHSYARKYPGHESVNFHFNKPGIDTETDIYGFPSGSTIPKISQTVATCSSTPKTSTLTSLKSSAFTGTLRF